MSLVTALVAGGVFGARHALEADHLAAVATLVDDDDRRTNAGLVGASWGIGHSLPIVAIGLLFLVAGVRLPEQVTRLFEVGVGIVLVYLGVRLVSEVSGLVDVERHAHGADVTHTHLRVGEWSLGPSHVHVSGDSFLVGVVHGVAGSGALVIALVASAPGVQTALAFLAAFCVLSIVTMAAVSALWGWTLGTDFTSYLKGGAGLVSVAVGVTMLAEQAVAAGLL